MHDAHAVAVVECLEQLVEVASDVVVGEGLVKLLEVCVVDMLEDEGGSARYRVFDYTLQCDDVCSAPKQFNISISF